VKSAAIAAPYRNGELLDGDHDRDRYLEPV
jgi:hypothetical protein